MDLFNAVKQSVSAREAAVFYGMHVSGKGMARCPFHDDHEPSLLLDDRYYCFGCGATGDASDLVGRLFGITPYAAAQKIAKDFCIQTAETVSDRTGQSFFSPIIPSTMPSKRLISIKSLLTPEQQQLKEEVRDCLFLICDRRRQLEALAEHFAPKSPGDVPGDEYAAALDLLTKNAQQFDLLLYGSDADKRAVVRDVTGGEGNV